MFHALHKVDMHMCYAKQNINLAYSYIKFSFYIQELHCRMLFILILSWARKLFSVSASFIPWLYLYCSIIDDDDDDDDDDKLFLQNG